MQEQSAPNSIVDSEVAIGQTSEKVAGYSIQRVLLMIAGLVLLLCLSLWGMYSLRPSDPYIQSVLQLTGDADRGREIFQLNCATCHGLDADGEVGPNLRDVSERKS
ncbi:MAG: cytochrome c, partial [Cyanobacteria bacterium P01_F01_bin.3]